MFFTNIYVGLKQGTDGGGRFPGAKDGSFRAWCKGFLDDQIRIMKPRAIIALGAHARVESKWHKGLVGPRNWAGIGFSTAALTHPSAPTYFEMMPDGRLRISHEATVLQQVAGINSQRFMDVLVLVPISDVKGSAW